MNQPQTYDRSVKITRPNDTTLEAGAAELSAVFAPEGVVVVSNAGDGALTFETVVDGAYHTRRVAGSGATKTLRRARLEARQWLVEIVGKVDQPRAEAVPVPGVYAVATPDLTDPAYDAEHRENFARMRSARADAESEPVPRRKGTARPEEPPFPRPGAEPPIGAQYHGEKCLCAPCCERRAPADEPPADRRRRQEREKKARYRLRKAEGLVGV